jgi:hypothetical protein
MTKGYAAISPELLKAQAWSDIAQSCRTGGDDVMLPLAVG